MKLSIMVTRRVKLALELEGALAVHADEAAAGLGEFFVPVLDDGTVLDAWTFLDGLRRKTAWWREHLTGLDLAHQSEVSEHHRWRSREAAQTKSLYDRLVSMRRTTRGLLTEQDLLRLGLAGTVAQDPVKVLRQSEKTWKRFQGDALKLESVEWPEEVRAQLAAMAARLGSDVKGLKKSVKEVRRARRKVESAAARRRRAIKDFDRQYLWIAKTAEMLFRMAGLDEAAERVKPRARRLDHDAGGGGGAAIEEILLEGYRRMSDEKEKLS